VNVTWLTSQDRNTVHPTNATFATRLSGAALLMVPNSVLPATELTSTTPSVIQKIVHSSSCCASAAAGIWSGDDRMKI
jgi:hypothetical protein